MLEHLPTSLPALTALSTLIAAFIGAIVAIVVAAVNAWSARRIAIDTAHRAYRSELAGSIVAATRRLLSVLHELETLAQGQDAMLWVHRAYAFAREPSGDEFRTPHDEVFANAARLFSHRRTQVQLWLASVANTVSPDDRISTFGLKMARVYIQEAAAIIDEAAEGYVFGLSKPLRRAALRLDAADTRPLKARIDERRRRYEGEGVTNVDAVDFSA